MRQGRAEAVTAGPHPRTVLVTGASSGIGLATAIAAGRAGDHVVLAARDPGALLAAERQCRAAGAASTRAVPTDIAQDDAVRRCVAEALDVTGRLDVVVNAAGVVSYGRTETVPAEVFDGVIRTNVLGSVNLARHVVPVLRGHGSGTFVLVGSVIGHIGVPGMSPYVLSKWGVRALARQLQLENRDRSDVHVVYLAPGGVDTPIYKLAGNYAGFVGRPPPPVTTPEKVAARILRAVDHPRTRVQVGLANNLMRLGFTTMPGVFDLLVGPLFSVAGRDRTDPVAPGAGNVLAPTPAAYGLRGHQGNPLVGILRNLRRRGR
jgi:NAD(P)-dependent dehydrogenase (short-subunit alcohol dehydrogenase family)